MKKRLLIIGISVLCMGCSAGIGTDNSGNVKLETTINNETINGVKDTVVDTTKAVKDKVANTEINLNTSTNGVQLEVVDKSKQ